MPDASLHDVKWTLKLIQPHLVQMAHDFWDTRTAILTGAHTGIYESYAEVQLRHCQSQSFPTVGEAQSYIDTYCPPASIELEECA